MWLNCQNTKTTSKATTVFVKKKEKEKKVYTVGFFNGTMLLESINSR